MEELADRSMAQLTFTTLTWASRRMIAAQGATGTLMVVVSLLAAYTRARRASAVDPMESLRVD